MPALQQLDQITLKQYEELPEDQRAEVFEGIVYDMASPSQEHQTISMELSTLINTYIKERNGSCRVFHAPFDVKLSDKPLTIVQPDIMVICLISNIPLTLLLKSTFMKIYLLIFQISTNCWIPEG